MTVIVKDVPTQDYTLLHREGIAGAITTHTWAPGCFPAMQKLVSELVLLPEEPVFLLSSPALTTHMDTHAVSACTQRHTSLLLSPCLRPGGDPSTETFTTSMTLLTSGGPLILRRNHSI